MKYIYTSILALFAFAGGLKAQFTTITYQKKLDNPKNNIETFKQESLIDDKINPKKEEVRKKEKKKNKKDLRREIDSLRAVISAYSTIINTEQSYKKEE